MKIVWDEPKRQRNLDGHGLDFAEVENAFLWESALIEQTYPGRLDAPRFAAIGQMHGQIVTLVFSPLGMEAISVISLRPASRRERKRYADS